MAGIGSVVCYINILEVNVNLAKYGRDFVIDNSNITWWCHGMGTLKALLALCQGTPSGIFALLSFCAVNPSVTGGLTASDVELGILFAVGGMSCWTNSRSSGSWDAIAPVFRHCNVYFRINSNKTQFGAYPIRQFLRLAWTSYER